MAWGSVLTWPLGALRAVLLRAAALVLFRKVAKHLKYVLHVARLPDEQPILLVPNHQSYFDGHVIAFLLWTLHGRRAYTVTNVKAFRGTWARLYHETAGDIAVDPADPAATYARIQRELASGKTLIIYPEGHRSESSALLPFRYGAFNLAVQLDVPLLPIAMRGTGRVLPKGSLWFRRGEMAGVAFGEIVRPSDFTEPDGDARRRAQRVMEHTRRTLEELVSATDAELLGDDALHLEAEHLADRARDALERLLDKGAENVSARDALRVLRITRLGRRLAWSLRLEVQHLRAFGFFVGSLPVFASIFLLPGFRRRIDALLARDPRQPYVNYVLGQYMLRVPGILGGDKARAVSAMETAYENAAAYNLSPSRFAVNYAASLAKNGRTDEALDLLHHHFGAGPESDSLRHIRRWHRAQMLLKRLGRERPTARILTQ
ncbi:lysophospholipid acyltransferase family protein [Pendulispora albinea]|uniref:1-acyl-sn-glycerol-3-phosphate acyltransferase n=1 Tax=Pendulispora albinea TaxID=2741071 RepID=A0ABZ2LZV2_9BACT